MKYWLKSLIIFTLISSVFLVGCQSTPKSDSAQGNTGINSTQSSNSSATTETNSPPVNNITDNNSKNMTSPKLEGLATVVMTVNGSPITIEIDGNNAPITAGNFVDLVSQGVYDGLVFHRVVTKPEPFVAQGGDPQGKDPSFPAANLGTGGFIDPTTKSQRYIPLEIRPEYTDKATPPEIIYGQVTDKKPQLKHTRGAIAMARSQMPDSASSQFYFALADLPFLDGSYAVFGRVTSGMDIVDKIKQGDRINSAKVTAGLENLKK